MLVSTVYATMSTMNTSEIIYFPLMLGQSTFIGEYELKNGCGRSPNTAKLNFLCQEVYSIAKHVSLHWLACFGWQEMLLRFSQTAWQLLFPCDWDGIFEVIQQSFQNAGWNDSSLFYNSLWFGFGELGVSSNTSDFSQTFMLVLVLTDFVN